MGCAERLREIRIPYLQFAKRQANNADRSKPLPNAPSSTRLFLFPGGGIGSSGFDTVGAHAA
jgi:hypothetical protein